MGTGPHMYSVPTEPPWSVYASEVKRPKQYEINPLPTLPWAYQSPLNAFLLAAGVVVPTAVVLWLVFWALA